MKVIFFGTPDFAVPSLTKLLEDFELLLVVTQPDKLKGRGHKLSSPPVKEVALSAGIRVLQPEVIRSSSFAEEVAVLKPDVIAVVAYGKIIPSTLLKIPALGCVNVHASLLPKYRGAAPIQRAVINGEAKTGITTMLMDEGLDTGDILLQEEMKIKDEDNAHTLAKRLSEAGARLLSRTLKGLEDSSIRPVPQKGEPTFAPPLKKEEGRIQWRLPARRIADLIRGTFPWPAAYCSLGGERITILKAKTTEGNGGAVPGRIEKVTEGAFFVGTGDGLLAVFELKPEGKKAMAASDFLRGRRLADRDSFDV